MSCSSCWVLQPRVGKGNNDLLAQTLAQAVASLALAPLPLLAAASVAAAEEPQGVHVFIPLFLISPASALAGDCLFI